MEQPRGRSDPLNFGTVEEIDNAARASRYGHRYYVMSPVFTVETGPVTVTISAERSDVDEAAGTKDVTVALSRGLTDGEAVTVPIRVTGAAATTDYTLELHGDHQGVTLLTGEAHSAQEPASAIRCRGLIRGPAFDPVDNSMRTQPWVTIGSAPRPRPRRRNHCD